MQVKRGSCTINCKDGGWGGSRTLNCKEGFIHLILKEGRSSTLYYTMEGGGLSSVNLERGCIYHENRGKGLICFKGVHLLSNEGIRVIYFSITWREDWLISCKDHIKILDVFMIFNWRNILFSGIETIFMVQGSWSWHHN